MEKDHFEILLEHIESNTKLLVEGQAGMNERLNRLESGQEEIKEKLLVQDALVAGHKVILTRLDNLEDGQKGLEDGQKGLEDGQKGLEEGQKGLEEGQKGILTRLDKIEAGQEAIKSDTRDTRRNMGLLNSIANDHESRLQGVESKLKDHLENHS